MASLKEIEAYTGEKTRLVDALILQLEGLVSAGERALLIKLSNRFIAALQVKNGMILNNGRNKALLLAVDSVFNEFGTREGLKIMQAVVQGVGKLIDFNGEYFSSLTGKTQVAPIKKEVLSSMESWLGITENGKVSPNGYLDKLIKDSSVRNQVKDLVIKEVITRSGVRETQKRLNDLIIGNEGKAGALSQYYKQFVNDTYSIADRITGLEFASKFNYKFAIYEGGLIKTSRPFCRERNGKVFHVSEIAQFDPPTAKPPDYNPFTDLGGYGCRHHLNFVPNSIALLLRPDIVDYEFFKEDSKKADSKF